MSNTIQTHILTPGLVKILVKIREAVGEKDRNCIHLQRDVVLKLSEYTNTQKLRYFTDLAQVDGKTGYWLITKLGGEFLRNEVGVITWVKTQDNHIVERSEQKKMIKDFYYYRDHAYFQEVWGVIKEEQPSLF